jgi:hypothetical protein
MEETFLHNHVSQNRVDRLLHRADGWFETFDRGFFPKAFGSAPEIKHDHAHSLRVVFERLQEVSEEGGRIQEQRVPLPCACAVTQMFRKDRGRDLLGRSKYKPEAGRYPREQTFPERDARIVRCSPVSLRISRNSCRNSAAQALATSLRTDILEALPPVRTEIDFR